MVLSIISSMGYRPIFGHLVFCYVTKQVGQSYVDFYEATLMKFKIGSSSSVLDAGQSIDLARVSLHNASQR